VNEELRSASSGLKERLDTCDAELQDVKTRLSRLYDVLETGKLSLDEFAPRLRELVIAVTVVVALLSFSV